MSQKSKIEWTGHTWNPWHGCKKVSPGCKYCYMYRDKERYKKDPTTVIVSTRATFNAPLSWKDPALVFTCSWSDFFIEEADGWRPVAWDIIRKTPHLTYQILTKRPERILPQLPPDWGDTGYPNVWIGISAEDQATADERISLLMKVPARVRFLSLEPLLEPIDITNKGINNGYSVPARYDVNPRTGKRTGIEWTDPGDSFIGVDWVIVGGESGNDTGKYRYRKAETPWFFKIFHDCQRNNVPLFVKQLGTHIAKEYGLKDRHGRYMDEFMYPFLKTREFPQFWGPSEPIPQDFPKDSPKIPQVHNKFIFVTRVTFLNPVGYMSNKQILRRWFTKI